MTTSTVDIKHYLEKVKNQTDQILSRYLPSVDTEPKVLHEAMRYSVMAGGKRLRPVLAFSAYQYCGGDTEGEDLSIHYAMAALEMVHTYSLIHDDLPCIDDDDLRRGIPTCHVKFGLAAAVLAGDALHDVAFNLLASTGSTKVVVELAHALGTTGMIGGQMADVEAEGKDVTKEEIIQIHTRKTGALIRASVRIGAILADCTDEQLAYLTEYGEKVGLAFQIIDDILDIEGDTLTMGKTVGADAEHLKATYPKAVGMEQAKLDAQQLIDEAVQLVEKYDVNVLSELAKYIGQRNN